MSDELVEFLRARLAEEWDELHSSPREVRKTSEWQHRLAVHAAHNNIVTSYQLAKEREEHGKRTWTALDRDPPGLAPGTLPGWESALMILAMIYSDHRDFRKPDWMV